MTLEQEIEHLKFLKQRLKFLKVRGSNKSKYTKIRDEISKHLDDLLAL